LERGSKCELGRGNRQSQLQINISLLDSLGKNDLRADKLAINLQELSAEVVRRCPLLLSERNNLDDIRLHLLYLIGRRQSQILSARDSGFDEFRGRPTSSASLRSSSAKRGLSGKRGRLGSACSSRSSHLSTSSEISEDVYEYLYLKETTKTSNHLNSNETFMGELDEHLAENEPIEQTEVIMSSDRLSALESKLEGLYGDEAERLVSMAFVRRLFRDEQNLASLSGNRLLVCAILRILRDSCNDVNRNSLSESIIYCLVKFTSFEDTYLRAFEETEPIDLMKIATELLVGRINLFARSQDLRHHYYYIGSLLILTTHVYQLQVEHKLMAPLDEKVVASLVQLLQLMCDRFANEIRLLKKPAQTVVLLAKLVDLLHNLSIFKEFINLIKTQHLQLVDSLVNLLSGLQTSRPISGSRASGSAELGLIFNDKHIQAQLYELEINLLRLINNLIHERRLRIRLTRRNFLKCVLRNLVVFLASRKTNSLKPYHESSVLLVPMRSLYELTCGDYIKLELYKSKIIMKCLLEYLLSATTDLRVTLMGAIERQKLPDREKNLLGLELQEQLIVEPSEVGQYIVCLWVNLSARREARVAFGLEASELKSLVCEYVELSSACLEKFCSIIAGGGSALEELNGTYLVVYLHLKLLRNLSHLFEPGEPGLVLDDLCSKWIKRMAAIASNLLDSASDNNLFVPLTIECLGILNNFLQSGGPKFGGAEQALLANTMTNLLDKLFKLEGQNFETENDDLLLVSTTLIGTLARYCELCAPTQMLPTTLELSAKILEASNFIFESRITDHEMIISSLYTLSQLMNHSHFLKDMSNLEAESADEASFVGSGHVGFLVDKLAELVSDADERVAKLAVHLLNRLRQLEERAAGGCVIWKRRFAIYNRRWLDAVEPRRVGHQQAEGVTSLACEMEEMREHELEEEYPSLDGNEMIDDSPTEEEEEECGELNVHLKTFDDFERPKSGHERRQRGQSALFAQIHGTMGSADSADEVDEDDEEQSSLEAPDLNVIDANSMIKHLSCRREIRWREGSARAAG